MIVGLGLDVVDLDRFRLVSARTPSIVGRLFTEEERASVATRRDPTEALAARFAAKEAVLKALGVGLGACAWHDIEVLRGPSGQPGLELRAAAADLASARRVAVWHLTLSHSALVAVAVAVAVAATAPDPDRF